MKTKLPIEELLRWRLARAEAEAPPPPRAARLLELARPWWETWPEHFRSLDQERTRRVSEQLPKVQVEITHIPPYEPEGGPDIRAEIGGKVSGELTPDLKVVIYARADAWYIQPTPYASHSIRSNNAWSSWTHTGSSYAALLVRSGFDPFSRLDVLPQAGGYVVARTIVEGIRK